MVKFLVFLLLILSSFDVLSQCPVGDVSGSCSGGGGALTNNYDFNTPSETRWVSGVSSFGSSNMNSTNITLRICGTLTISSINMNSSTCSVIVESGGVLNITGSWSPSQGKITNYGIINISGDITLNGVKLINTGTLNLTGGSRTFTINNTLSNVSNIGLISTDNFVINATASGILCVENNSCLNITNNFTNNQNNSIMNGSSSPAIAAIFYGGTATFNNTLSSYSSVHVCKNGGSSPSNLGSAVFTSSCSNGCSTILPIRLFIFLGYSFGDYNIINWVTLSEYNNDYFTLERSSDGFDYVNFLNVSGRNLKKISKYIANDLNPYDTTYYRLKQTDYDGSFTYSDIISVTKKRQKHNYVKIIDVFGRVMDYNIDYHPILPNGVYFMISDDNTSKIVIY